MYMHALAQQVFCGTLVPKTLSLWHTCTIQGALALYTCALAKEVLCATLVPLLLSHIIHSALCYFFFCSRMLFIVRAGVASALWYMGT
jgi:hypothetical protein